MALFDLVTEEMGFRIQFGAFFLIQLFSQLKKANGEMGKKTKKENMKGLLQPPMNSDEKSEREQLNQSEIEKALGEVADVMEIWIGRVF